jgi:hypothetical protein
MKNIKVCNTLPGNDLEKSLLLLKMWRFELISMHKIFGNSIKIEEIGLVLYFQGKFKKKDNIMNLKELSTRFLHFYWPLIPHRFDWAFKRILFPVINDVFHKQNITVSGLYQATLDLENFLREMKMKSKYFIFSLDIALLLTLLYLFFKS